MRPLWLWSARAIGGVALTWALGTVTVAWAVAHAPNGSSAAAADDPCPPELGSATSATLSVGRTALSSWIAEPTGPARGTVVLLHGVRLDKRSMLPSALSHLNAGYRVVLLDLRGHGRSGGGYLTYGVDDARDVSAVLDGLEARGIRLGPVGVHGFSYGAATALELSARDPRVRAVVAVSSFSSLRSVTRDYVRWQLPALAPAVPDAWLDSAVDLGALWAGFDADAAAPARAAARTRAAVLIVHGSDDPQVSPDNARAIAEACAGRAELQVLAGETHASVLADARGEVRLAATRWFGQHL
ncbi:MAG: alpha/beta fold hydrolase [Polyangiaceae bacterium]|nr:alpha/beta fold hydrolase [Polyangiaceae bacterium]